MKQPRSWSAVANSNAGVFRGQCCGNFMLVCSKGLGKALQIQWASAPATTIITPKNIVLARFYRNADNRRRFVALFIVALSLLASSIALLVRYSSNAEQIQYTSNVGDRLDRSGAPKYFPGITLACVIEDQQLLSTLKQVHAVFTHLPFAHKYSLVPLDNFHITVFGILNFMDRDSPKPYSLEWPANIPKTNSIPETDRLVKEIVSTSIASVEKFLPFQFEIRSSDFALKHSGSQGILLTPKTEQDSNNLMSYRKSWSEIFGLDLAKKKRDLHITIGYLIQQLSIEEISFFETVALPQIQQILDSFGIVSCDSPRLMFFDNIFRLHERR